MPNSDDDSDFAEYGTSLEPIEEDEVARKRPIAVQDQVAVDERGRRRFHGAFTGGFSAGYFNTVGSKEGWAPSTFKSSRADRGSFKNQNVLDFMDDEDKGAFGIAPQVLRPTDDFVDRSDQNQARARKRPFSAQDGPIPGMSALEQIIQPVKETVGIKMLIKMGWRPGKGIGPKRDKKSKRSKMTPKEKEPPLIEQSEVDIQDQEDMDVPSNASGGETKRYGCSLPPKYAQGGSDSEESFGDLSEAEKLLAPDDVSSLLCNPKENTFGLGYKGLDRNTLTSMSSQGDLFGTKLKFRVGSKNMDISGQAFGVGAFEEADDDIYAREDMSQYDFALETPEERKRRKAKEESEKRKKKNKENCIEGFQICASIKLRRKVFPPPHLPPNFEPVHSTKKSRFEGGNTLIAAEAVTEVKGLDRHKLTISERQVLIEESSNRISKDSNQAQDKQEKTPTTTAEDDVNASKTSEPKQSEKDIQERIEKLKKFTQVLQAYSSKTPEETDKVSFKPFMKNPEKQERYDKYLTLVKAGFSECLRDLQPSDMTDWERDREKMEFDRASKLYKPMNSVLSNRFVSAKSHDISHLEPEKEAVVQKDPKDDPKVAAQMKLFGKLTHRVVEWHPDKLVCKRFNIPHPYPDSKFVGIRGDPSFRGSKASSLEAVTSTDNHKPAIIAPPPKKSLFEDLDFSKPPPGLLPPEEAQNTAASNVLDFQKEITSSSNKAEENEDSIPIEKPPLDLFKEIFADSSESEDEEEESSAKLTKVATEKKSSSSSRDKVQAPTKESDNTKESNNTKPDTEAKKVETQRRVFDRIDLDKLQHKTQSENKITDDHGEKSKDDDEDMDDAYGPLPPKPDISSSSSSALRPTFIPRSSVRDSFSTKSKGLESSGRAEDVVWVEKSAVSESIKSSKSKKYSSKKSHKKSGKKDKHKSSKSKKHKKEPKKKNHKHKSKSKSKHVSGNESSGSDSESDSSDSSVTINDSLDNKNLLAKLKQFTKSK